MWKQIRIMTRLELVNFMGFNVLRHTKDKREKGKKRFLASIIVIVILVFAGYAGGIAGGLILLGLGDIVPAYLTAIASFLILFFGIFKAGNVIFRRNGYDILSSLPVSQTAIVCGRFARMYLENLVIASVAVLPGILVCGVLLKPDPGFYLFGITGLFLIPLIPMSLSVFIGALVTAVSSRMRNKSIVEAVLSIVLVAGLFSLLSGVGGAGEELDPERLKELAGTIQSVLGKIYLPSLWLSAAMTENRIFLWLLYAVVSLLLAAAAVAITASRFHAISRRLFGTSAKHNYRMQALEQGSLLGSLCRRELKRYFSSGVYMTNTIIGPIMGAAFSIGIFAMGVSGITEKLPFALDVYSVIPLVAATVFCMMNMACVSVSMEGRNWWIIKSLPLDTRSILDAKLLASLLVVLPFYLTAEIFLLLALKPGFGGGLWTVFGPMLCIVFCSVFGITVNLHMPVLNWDNEVSVVKQSAAAMIGGLGGALVPLLGIAAMVLAPAAYAGAARAGYCVLLTAATVFLYRMNSRADLREIE